jgi:hypothetical protein
MMGKAQLRDRVRDLRPGMAVQRFYRWLIAPESGGLCDPAVK